MKKIMFSDRYDLTIAVLKGWKTMTRRIAYTGEVVMPNSGYLTESKERGTCVLCDGNRIIAKSRYKVGEVVAVAQAYKVCLRMGCLTKSAGWDNKMFVHAILMPHRIRITNIRIEKLQDISDEGCIREGIEEDSPYYWVPVNQSLPNWRKIMEGVSDMYPNDRDGKVYPHFWDSPRKAFAALIDKVSGKGTWERNPWVFVYEFELIK